MARILLVEDDEEHAETMEQTLRLLGYEVVGLASNAVQCLSLVQSSKPDLVLMDVQLRGDLDGIDAATRLRKITSVAIVYVTGFTDDATLRRARSTLAHGYVVKPFRSSELKIAIEIALCKHKMEVELARREHWYSSILRATGDAIVAVDVHGNLAFANPAAIDLCDDSSHSAVGTPFEAAFHLVHRHSRESIDVIRRVLETRSPVRLPPGVVLACKGGDLPVEESIAPIVDEAGQVLGAVVVLRDIRDREALHQQVAASDRLASLGTLAAGIAHEINNPLTYILANAALAERELAGWQARGGAEQCPPRSSRLRRDLSEIKDGAERIRRIVADLALFARPDPGPSHGDVVSALQWALRVTSTLTKSRAEVELHIEPVPAVRGDMTRLGQVFVNLLVNAAHAIGESKCRDERIEVSTGVQGERAMVTIRDSGCGMTEDVQRRIFEPFFTTKPVGTGTGLGLSVCRGIVDSMGGEITVESQAGVGSVFRVYVPFAEQEAGEDLKRQEPSLLHGRVLVIDDDEIVAKSIGRMLEANHHVEVATDPRLALAKLQADPHFDAIVSDLLMPHLSGIDLYRQLLQSHPRLAARIVFISGAFTMEASEFLAGLDNPRLPKPPSIGELELCVQAVLRTQQQESGYHRVVDGEVLSASGVGKA